MISLNEEQMDLLRKEIKLDHPYFDEKLIEEEINKFLQEVDPILLPNVDEYLYNKPLSKIEFVGYDVNFPISLHDVLVQWTNCNLDIDAYKTGCVIEALKLFSKYYRKEIFFDIVWYYCGPWPC